MNLDKKPRKTFAPLVADELARIWFSGSLSSHCKHIHSFHDYPVWDGQQTVLTSGDVYTYTDTSGYKIRLVVYSSGNLKFVNLSRNEEIFYTNPQSN